MKDLRSNKQKTNVQTHIDKGWAIIDTYLPVTYVEKVLANLPEGYTTKHIIRNVRAKIQKPEYQMEIFLALVEVAKSNRDLIESLSKI